MYITCSKCKGRAAEGLQACDECKGNGRVFTTENEVDVKIRQLNQQLVKLNQQLDNWKRSFERYATHTPRCLAHCDAPCNCGVLVLIEESKTRSFHTDVVLES